MKRKKFTRYDNLIDKAVKDSIDDFIKSMKTSNNSIRIDGDIPDAGKFIRTFSNINSLETNTKRLDEGLIKTYPPETTIKYIIKKYRLNQNQLQIRPINNGIISVDIICIFLPNSTDNNVLGDIKHDLQTCGYFDSQQPVLIPNTSFFMLVFEPKYSIEITDIVKQKFKYLYHSTAKIYLNSIKENGLVPKSKNSIFLYPDRTFLMLGNKLDTKQIDVLKNVQHTRNTHITKNNPKETKEYVLIYIDVSKLPPNVKFYCDPMAYMAIFTYNNIPPNVISYIKPFTL